MTTRLTWHPFAEKFPLLDGAEWDEFKASVKATGGIADNPILYRVSEGQWQGLDGRNRLRACEELGLTPSFKKVKVKDEDVPEFIIRQNITRRHLSAESRREIVVALRAEGLSLRKIAETLGVGKGTVERDLAASAEPPKTDPSENGQVSPNGTPATQKPPENATLLITGRDGKNYPATPSKAPKLCKRCKRVGAVADCLKCAQANKPRPKRKPQPKGEIPKGDAEGLAVPNDRQDAWAALAAFGELKAMLNKAQKQAGELAEVSGGFFYRKHHLEAIHADEKVRHVCPAIRDAIKALDGLKPHVSVCPYCEHKTPGKVDPKCRACQGQGWGPKSLLQSCPEDYLDAVKKKYAGAA